MRCSPDRSEFHRTARPGARMVVTCDLLADHETPVAAYRKLARSSDQAFLLESVEHGEHSGHYSFVGSVPRAVATYREGAGLLVTDAGERRVLGPDPTQLAQEETSLELVVPEGVELPRFVGGVLGFVGYECGACWERVAIHEPSASDAPDAVLLVTDTLLAFDHLRHRAVALTSVPVTSTDANLDELYDEAVSRLESLVATLSEPVEVPGLLLPHDAGVPTAPGEDSDFGTPNRTPADFCAAVDAAREHIAAGNAIQVVVSQRWDRPTEASALDVYRALRIVNPSPYMYLLSLGDLQLVGASPELLVQVTGTKVATRPIAGTRPRGATPQEDLRLEEELRVDPKELAEHAMLVDLGRNDIGRISTPGTVRVDELLTVERYSHVMHLTSHVSGDLRPELGPLDALRACFPAGTVSGAPKVRAMQIIAELEPDRRGPYAGAVGYVGYDGSLDMAITIRTIVHRQGVASVQAGAGIVADSVPEREFEETRNKARALARAVELAERIADGAPTALEVTR